MNLPPGTADVQQQLASDIALSGAVLVVTPQDVAHLDAKKVLTMLTRAKVPVLGAVENMAALACPGCDTSIELFPPTPRERSIWAAGVRQLGVIPSRRSWHRRPPKGSLQQIQNVRRTSRQSPRASWLRCNEGTSAPTCAGGPSFGHR